MQGDGPIMGDPKQAGVLVIGRNLAAVDATCCRIMQIDPLQIGYLRLTSGRPKSHLMERNIRQIGEAIVQFCYRQEYVPPALMIDRDYGAPPTY